jgi:hypothetical protein
VRNKHLDDFFAVLIEKVNEVGIEAFVADGKRAALD